MNNREEEPLLGEPKKILEPKKQNADLYNNVNKKVSGLVVILSSLFIVFLLCVALDFVGIHRESQS